MNDIEFECDCGRAECQAQVSFRKGFVCVRPCDGGREETRWDYFYVDAYQSGKVIQIMLPPEAARQIMWFMVGEFMPVINKLVRLWRFMINRARMFLGEE